MAKIIAIFAAFLLSWPAAAAPVAYSFTATVTAWEAHPQGETFGRAAAIGDQVTGGYSYEVNPNDPDQTINNRFWFTVGEIDRDNDNLLLMAGGKVYSQIVEDGGGNPELAYDEVFHVTPDEFYFEFRNRYGWVHLTAAVTDLRVAVPAPAGLLLLVAGLAVLWPVRRRMSHARV